ncbi:MAG: GMC family oxidoreductase, partial [Fimbriimonadaceae bacterium]|nr:GMC family oxidoreductase [Alphaproteobacteria bacterium]
IVRELRIPKFRCEIEAVGASTRRLKSLRSGSPDLRDILQLVANPYEVGNALKCDSDTRPSAYLLMNYVEQTPNPASRITLAGAQDALGRPQTELSWKLSRQDHDGIVKSHRHLALEVGKSDFGRMKIEIEPDPEILLENCFSGSHHMGTTRMSSTPGTGVADENAKVFHTNNLYIAGSSLFPTSGYANPTLTIVALTIKLADHIRLQMRGDGIL